MSREIKFRAWNTLEDKFVAGSDLSDRVYRSYTDGSNSMELKGGIYRITNSLELMQYTGLKDKNGVEIYEGDICKVSLWPQQDFELRVVTYDAPSFYLAKRLDDRVGVDLFSTPGAYEEVVGNIYENPELLRG